ncbi:hypothetical protein BK668_08600 [Pseudomonas fluorescens]|nr:hypothetical protein BK668_08600 [Pseudomonas fluorescens]
MICFSGFYNILERKMLKQFCIAQLILLHVIKRMIFAMVILGLSLKIPHSQHLKKTLTEFIKRRHPF